MPLTAWTMPSWWELDLEVAHTRQASGGAGLVGDRLDVDRDALDLGYAALDPVLYRSSNGIRSRQTSPGG